MKFFVFFEGCNKNNLESWFYFLKYLGKMIVYYLFSLGFYGFEMLRDLLFCKEI